MLLYYGTRICHDSVLYSVHSPFSYCLNNYSSTNTVIPIIRDLELNKKRLEELSVMLDIAIILYQTSVQKPKSLPLIDEMVKYANFKFMHSYRRRIRLMESNANCRYLKKLRQVFTVYLLRPPPLLSFCLRWCSNFVGSESGQKQSVKLLQNMVSNTTQHPHPLPATHCLYVLYFYFGKGGSGGCEQERRLEGQ
jgi:hypothetical protein